METTTKRKRKRRKQINTDDIHEEKKQASTPTTYRNGTVQHTIVLNENVSNKFEIVFIQEKIKRRTKGFNKSKLMEEALIAWFKENNCEV
ncbi:MAG: hypothetical protein GY714_29350 [Desulfobacterales bacterium]|nr:hypothetical protein [Desulfobacterales bacterium]